MAAIASKLKDPALRKGAAADDLAALESTVKAPPQRELAGGCIVFVSLPR